MPVDIKNKQQLSDTIKAWGSELGFQQLGITTTALAEDEAHLIDWLKQGRHGAMSYMESHGTKRSRPEDLVPGTLSVISVRMDYMPPSSKHPMQVLNNNELAYISRYAMGRDYHKLMRQRLQKLATKIEKEVGDFGYRCFTDSAPVLEKALARNAGLGWIGKHSNLINPKAGSWFFLGEIYTDLPLEIDKPFSEHHCGSCNACIDICPTQAIVAPMQVDARRCISYLTIEMRESIPEEFRKMIGNRVYGCDDCQLICPWNKFSKNSEEDDFRVRHGLDSPTLVGLFAWTETEFLKNTEGSAIRRIGYEAWSRNIAVGLGNAPSTNGVINALKERANDPSALVREHATWAIAQHT
ncbi:MAG TPA: tRNA epoxyqueuosine(34) reductase QueG [Thiotrichaceae bacterium]|jgi:epoxyqueuosine reductase|nr:tRNA epoxyqueuosine(34) reductase QueG [Thiotrichaceae bacterium]HIM09027.1 tRNA epoxyqueuosine(34) reductase QueG [Gammaproteobacteria bacterium]